MQCMIGETPLRPYLILDLSTAMENLKTSLIEIRAYSSEFRKGHFNENFNAALEILHSEFTPTISTDIDPTKLLSSEAIKSIFACFKCNVSGAMGSWNDYFTQSDEEEVVYTRVSLALGKAVTALMVAAVNSAYETRGLT